ncbi:MAG: hypothetical protein HDT44_09800 [Ruminococcaceae bacterium]|nr:hypothetical protein [Oscillospiraceae bacterium]
MKNLGRGTSRPSFFSQNRLAVCDRHSLSKIYDFVKECASVVIVYYDEDKDAQNTAEK